MWLLLQIADSAFPTGGFAHSGGLEAAAQLGLGGADVAACARAAVWQAALAGAPLVSAAHGEPERIEEWDARAQAALPSHVARGASVRQGRAFAATCARSFDLAAVDGRVRAGRIAGHLAPVFGACARGLEVARGDTLTVWLHLALRGTLAAAVRLGLIGPHEAQRVQRGLHDELDAARAACAGLGPDDVAQPAPLLELAGALHDRLYSRLFQS